MKLFAFVFCIALMVNEGSSDDYLKKKAEKKKAVMDELEMIRQTIDNTWTLHQYIPIEVEQKIRNLAAEYQGDFRTTLDQVKKAMVRVLNFQWFYEIFLKESYAQYLTDQYGGEDILSIIWKGVDELLLGPEKLENLLEHVKTIHKEFKKYESFVKQVEKEFLDKLFPGINDACNLAIEAMQQIEECEPKDIKKIGKIGKAAKRSIEGKLSKLDKTLKKKDKLYEPLKKSMKEKYDELLGFGTPISFAISNVAVIFGPYIK